ncbi:MAG TPA: DUF2242 domain-containing protein [Burkholderiales bacterium]|nr:DUF2242 domain-containing protein [Burkholderiales bacterium]
MPTLESVSRTLATGLWLIGVTAALSGCAKDDPLRKEASFRPDTPYAAKVVGRGEDVCWSVKRAFLTQGYMIDRGGSDTLIMSGTKDVQTDDETNVSLRMQTTCVDNRDGTSTVFATATKEVSKVQRVAHSATLGASVATISVPTWSERALRLQQRETIQDPKFYEGFYALVQKFAKEENQPRRRD